MKKSILFFLLAKEALLYSIVEKGHTYNLWHPYYVPQKIVILGTCNDILNVSSLMEVFENDDLIEALRNKFNDPIGKMLYRYLLLCLDECYSKATIKCAFKSEDESEILHRLQRLVESTPYAGIFYLGIIGDKNHCVHESWLNNCDILS